MVAVSCTLLNNNRVFVEIRGPIFLITYLFELIFTDFWSFFDVLFKNRNTL